MCEKKKYKYGINVRTETESCLKEENLYFVAMRKTLFSFFRFQYILFFLHQILLLSHFLYHISFCIALYSNIISLRSIVLVFSLAQKYTNFPLFSYVCANFNVYVRAFMLWCSYALCCINVGKILRAENYVGCRRR